MRLANLAHRAHFTKEPQGFFHLRVSPGVPRDIDHQVAGKRSQVYTPLLHPIQHFDPVLRTVNVAIGVEGIKNV